MALELKPFDVADHLTDHDVAAEYLRLALESRDSREIVMALADVSRARGGVAQLATDTGLPLTTLKQVFSDEGNPDLKTLVKIFDALGVKLTISTGSPEPIAA